MTIRARLAIAAVGGVLLFIASSAGAQTAGGAAPTLKSLGLECDDFAPIGNGLWKPTHPFDLTVGPATASMTPLKSFGPSDLVLGVPLAKLLQSECVK